jgi:hypothetical protein
MAPHNKALIEITQQPRLSALLPIACHVTYLHCVSTCATLWKLHSAPAAAPQPATLPVS